LCYRQIYDKKNKNATSLLRKIQIHRRSSNGHMLDSDCRKRGKTGA
jgi:hypothetical protein